jgi:hypothetical protein
MTIIINTRADLDVLKGTPDYLPALRAIAGTMETTVNTAEYPEGYGDPSYNGPSIEPAWTAVETLETIRRLGFASRAEFEAEYAAATAEAG